MLMLFAGGEKNGTKKHFNRQNIATSDFTSQLKTGDGEHYGLETNTKL